MLNRVSYIIIQVVPKYIRHSATESPGTNMNLSPNSGPRFAIKEPLLNLGPRTVIRNICRNLSPNCLGDFEGHFKEDLKVKGDLKKS